MKYQPDWLPIIIPGYIKLMALAIQYTIWNAIYFS